MDEVLTLWSDDLFSKWGFNDGDLPDPVWDLIINENLDRRTIHWRDVLCNLVKKYVLPLLDQEVGVYQMSTAHNPIRVEYVKETIVTDSISYNDTELLPPIRLTPEMIEIPMSVVLEEIRSTIQEEVC